jgi:hypothetical protein
MDQRARVVEVTVAYLCYASTHTVKTYRLLTGIFWGRTRSRGKPATAAGGDLYRGGEVPKRI